MMGAGILLIVLGAILAVAVDISTPGLDLSALGVILLLVGVAVVVADLVMSGAFRRGTSAVVETPPEVVTSRESGVVEDSYIDESVKGPRFPPPTTGPEVSRRRIVRRRRLF